MVRVETSPLPTCRPVGMTGSSATQTRTASPRVDAAIPRIRLRLDRCITIESVADCRRRYGFERPHPGCRPLSTLVEGARDGTGGRDGATALSRNVRETLPC